METFPSMSPVLSSGRRGRVVGVGGGVVHGDNRAPASLRLRPHEHAVKGVLSPLLSQKHTTGSS